MQVYFVPHVGAVGSAPQAARLGAAWLAEHQHEGTPFILIPTKRAASGNNVIEDLIKAKVPWGIPRNFPPTRWPGGPVLAPWATDKVIERIAERSERVTSLCVLKWLEHENQDWLKARQAIDLTNPSQAPLAPTITDGVVLVAMENITHFINLSTGLGHPSDYEYALRVLEYLKHQKRELVAEEIIPWALANRWGVKDAKDLKKVIDGLNAGRAFRGIRQARLRDRGAQLRKWEQEAKSRTPK